MIGNALLTLFQYFLHSTNNTVTLHSTNIYTQYEQINISPSNLAELVRLSSRLATMLFIESNELRSFSVPTHPWSLVRVLVFRDKPAFSINITECNIYTGVYLTQHLVVKENGTQWEIKSVYCKNLQINANIHVCPCEQTLCIFTHFICSFA